MVNAMPRHSTGGRMGQYRSTGFVLLARLRLFLEEIHSHQENDGDAHESGQDLRKSLWFEEVMKLEQIDHNESQDDRDRQRPSHLFTPGTRDSLSRWADS